MNSCGRKISRAWRLLSEHCAHWDAPSKACPRRATAFCDQRSFLLPEMVKFLVEGQICIDVLFPRALGRGVVRKKLGLWPLTA
jgi:hypothetical protein